MSRLRKMNRDRKRVLDAAEYSQEGFVASVPWPCGVGDVVSVMATQMLSITTTRVLFGDVLSYIYGYTRQSRALVTHMDGRPPEDINPTLIATAKKSWAVVHVGLTMSAQNKTPGGKDADGPQQLGVLVRYEDINGIRLCAWQDANTLRWVFSPADINGFGETVPDVYAAANIPVPLVDGEKLRRIASEIGDAYNSILPMVGDSDFLSNAVAVAYESQPHIVRQKMTDFQKN